MRKILLLLPMILLVLSGWAQQKKMITGTVLDKLSNQPLAGVSVQIKTRAVMTDASGKFSIEASNGDVITFSFVGMAAQK